MTLVDMSSLVLRVVLFPFEELKKIALFHVTYDRYIKLKQDSGILQTKLIQQEEILAENKRLKGLLDLKFSAKYPMIAANVIGRDSSNWNAIIIIDRGQKDGLRPGMAVIDTANVVGKILEVGRNTAKVMLLSDPSFSVAAILQRSRETGLVSGSLQGSCRMRYLSPEADIRAGDVVITSTLSSSFPEGLLIGEVIRIEESQASPTMECLLRPAASLSQLEEVLVIKNK